MGPTSLRGDLAELAQNGGDARGGAAQPESDFGGARRILRPLQAAAARVRSYTGAGILDLVFRSNAPSRRNGGRRDVRRCRHAKQAAAYAELTTRVFQSGEGCRTGHISKFGSPYLRWILVESAMKFVTKDDKVAAFYQLIRKRSSNKIARVSAARKMPEICYKRLLRWHRAHDTRPATATAA